MLVAAVRLALAGAAVTTLFPAATAEGMDIVARQWVAPDAVRLAGVAGRWGVALQYYLADGDCRKVVGVDAEPVATGLCNHEVRGDGADLLRQRPAYRPLSAGGMEHREPVAVYAARPQETAASPPRVFGESVLFWDEWTTARLSSPAARAAPTAPVVGIRILGSELVAVDAVCLSRLLGEWALAEQDVLAVGYGHEMFRIGATRILAAVVEFQPLRYWADAVFVGESVRPELSEATVSAPVFGASPVPATRSTVNGDFLAKQAGNLPSHV